MAACTSRAEAARLYLITDIKPLKVHNEIHPGCVLRRWCTSIGVGVGVVISNMWDILRARVGVGTPGIIETCTL